MKQRTRHIILALSKREDAEHLRSVLARSGYEPTAVCVSGAQALAALEDYPEAVLITGKRLKDLSFHELADNLPDSASLLLIANPAQVEDVPENVVFLPMPLKAREFLSTVDLLVVGITPGRHARRGSKRERTREEREAIEQAKALLMERHHMTEPEAHRYLQKRAMDNGCDIVETAQMVLSLELT